ncbi:MAG: hypothetical protein COA59_06015 [Colwellia sp.]|nr:MAG: hypothetical protein COA59_06015 [Colwellia sp.]
MLDALLGIYEFLTSGIYGFVVEFYAWVIIKITYFRYEAMLWSLNFSWDIAQSILIQLDISTQINNSLSRLPQDTVSQLNFFNIITGFNLLINAFVTRFVMGFRVFG